MMNCLNCGEKLLGRFCSQCGQKSSVRKLTLGSVAGDFLNAISDSDQGWPRTLIDLTINPGKMINNYLAGKRKRYLQAGKYTLLNIVAFTIVISLVEAHFGFFEKATQSIDKFTVVQDGQNILLYDSEKTLTKNNPKAEPIRGDKKMELDFTAFGVEVKKNPTRTELLAFIKYLLPRYHSGLFDWLKILVALWIPVFTFFTYMVFFRSPRNLAEHLVINSYLYAHILFIFIVVSPIYWIAPNQSSLVTKTAFFLSLFYLIYSYMEIFRDRPKRLIKALTVLALASTTYLTSLASAVFILLLYIAVQNINYL
jgi:hypothetical protein